jgi:2-aminoadipate transaminase
VAVGPAQSAPSGGIGTLTQALPPCRGLFFWARLTGAGGKIKDGNELAKRAIEQGVAFVPGTPFFATHPDVSSPRLSFATVGEDKIREGVERLGKAV